MKKIFLTLTMIVSLAITSAVFTSCNNEEERDSVGKSLVKRPIKNSNFIISFNSVDVLVFMEPNGKVPYFRNIKTGTSYAPDNRNIMGWPFPYNEDGLAMAKDYLKDVECGGIYEGINAETGEKSYVALYTNDGGDCSWIYEIEKITLK